ncbi:MAG: SDR family NAD(P)-dependent oxidoreductase [Deltaproteobacteria bacterium]|nr:SDR family NAD(P)-dependent oxidoreductase [Deltaproteobacteria bacterium]
METAYHSPLSPYGASHCVTQVREGTIVPLIEFGGNAIAYWEELVGRYHESMTVRNLVDRVAKKLNDTIELSDISTSGILARGLPLQRWLQEPSAVPPADYLASGTVSMPLIFLTQIGHVISLRDQHPMLGEIFDRAVGYVGHSQGVMTGLCFATGREGEGFAELVEAVACYFLWQAFRMQQALLPGRVTPAEYDASTHRGDGAPAPMAAIAGLERHEIETLLTQAPTTGPVVISVINDWDRMVLSGSMTDLLRVREQLLQWESAWTHDLVTKHRRVGWQYLQMSSPFHSPYMVATQGQFEHDLVRLGIHFDAHALRAPLYGTAMGNNLQQADDLTAALIAMQWTGAVDWPTVLRKATHPAGGACVTHIVDFGPGDGVAKITARQQRGRGIGVIMAATDAGRTQLLSEDPAAVPRGEDWERFRPRLHAVASVPSSDSRATPRLWLDNRFSRFTKVPPIFGGGMTPTSVEIDMVVAAANAGYLQEWAGGGQVTEAIWDGRADELRQALLPGRGIIFNALYLDPYLWRLHFPRILEQKRRGIPYIGMTISAGIPEVEEASRILRALLAEGLWCNAFKPGNDAQIAQVLQIADANPDVTLLMHVEGGKAGGHHSWEDLHGLILRNYAAIRVRANVILCVGGGIGTPEAAACWLMGSWHHRDTLPVMPVDAVFLGTRLMACKEAKTSPQVKAQLVRLQGTTEWIRPQQVCGGMTSQKSQMDADIHCAESGATRAGRLLDALAGQPRETIVARKQEIVALLAKTAKPYFGDLPAMTYAGVLARMVALMAPGAIAPHLPHDGPWYDRSFRERALAWAQRAEARCAPRTSGAARWVGDPRQLDDPAQCLSALRDRYPAMETTRLHAEDVAYFLFLCRQPGKPVNFVPVIDEDVRRWYKADSLWQSHDPRYPADAVITVPGPEAVRSITAMDEPIATVFSAFEQAAIAAVERADATRDRERPLISFVGEGVPTACTELTTAVLARTPRGAKTVYTLTAGPATVPDGREWRAAIAQWGSGPLCAFLRAPAWWVEGRTVPNHAERLLQPLPGETWQVTVRNGRVHELATSWCTIAIRGDHLSWTLRSQSSAPSMPEMTLRYGWCPENGMVPIRANDAENRRAMLGLYAAVWTGTTDAGEILPLRVGTTFEGKVRITAEAIRAFVAATGETAAPCISGDVAPPAMAVCCAWAPFARALLACGTVADLLQLVHTKQTIEMVRPMPICAGDPLRTRLTITAIRSEAHGTVVAFSGTILRGREPLVRLTSECFLRECFLAAAASDPSKTDLSTSHAVPLETPYTAFTSVITAPHTAEAYAAASGDRNPIHREGPLAVLAGFDGPIMHGMWSAAALLAEMTHRWADGDPTRIARCAVQFAQPLFPGEPATIQARHLAMRSAASCLEAQVRTERGVIATAQVDLWPASTAYLFTGQGSQQVGMGMAAYARSAAVRDVWDRAEAFCRARYGFSILTIVRENPTVLHLPLPHGGIETIRHPRGVLHLTQFTQVALTVVAIAGVAELRERGCDHPRAIFAGHSLGEYAALSASGILPLETVLSSVYHRGLTMQHYVPRTADGVSPYRMAVVRPNLVGMCEDDLQADIARILQQRAGSLEIVNFNITGEQYAVTGETALLKTLEERLQVRASARGVDKPPMLMLEGIDVPFHSTVLREGVPAFRATLEETIPARIDPAALIGRYIPNLNADPFAIERAYVEAVATQTDSPLLRALLARPVGDRAWRPAAVARTLLIELLAYQFASPVQWIRTQELLLTDPRCRVAHVVEIGPQPVLANMLRRTLKHLPVQRAPSIAHIEQDRAVVFCLRPDAGPAETSSPAAVSELREREGGGPSHSAQSSTVLRGPAQLGLDPALPVGGGVATTESGDPAQLGGRGSPRRREPEGTRAPQGFQQPHSGAEGGTQRALPVGGATRAPVIDVPYDVTTGLRALMALKLRLRPDEIAPSDTIERLTRGNSARRNEILADIGAEFQVGAIDEAHNKPVSELIALITAKGSYTAPGPYLRVATDHAITQGLPLSRAEILTHLQRTWQLADGRLLALTVLLPCAVRHGVSSGSGPLSPIGLEHKMGAREVATAWLDRLVEWYGLLHDVHVPRRAETTAGGGATVDAAALEALEQKYFGREGLLGDVTTALLRAGNRDPYQPVLEADQELLKATIGGAHVAPSSGKAAGASPSTPRCGLGVSPWGPTHELALYRGALGPQFERVMAPCFDAERAVTLSSHWNWARRDLIDLYWRVERGSCPIAKARREGTAIAQRADEMVVVTAAYCAARAVSEGRTVQARLFARIQKEAQQVLRTAPALRPSPDVVAAVERLLSHGGLPDVVRQAVRMVLRDGLSLAGQVVLVTGAGPGSIGAEIAGYALQGGATVIVASSRLDQDRVLWWRERYQRDGARGATLVLLPANQGNQADCRSLVRWISAEYGHLDLLFPFAAIKEFGDVTTMDAGAATATWRVLVQGVEWLTAAVAEENAARNLAPHATTISLPGSPNQGLLGGDGAYGASKAALEVLTRRWRSEFSAWGRYTRMIGAQIGWTRGTGLMQANDAIAQALEARTGCQTFATTEMGFLLVALMHPSLRALATQEPLWVSLTGGFERIPEIGAVLRSVREALAAHRADPAMPSTAVEIPFKADPAYFAFPPLSDPEQRPTPMSAKALPPDEVYVVVGYGEVSPYGSARTRWEVECGGLSNEGCLELAWLTGRIRFSAGRDYVGWLDAASGEPVPDHAMKARYETILRKHAGVRLVDPAAQGFDPRALTVLADVQLPGPLVIPVTSQAEGEAYCAKFPGEAELVVDRLDASPSHYGVRLPKGSVIKVPMAARLSRYVAGQIPTGWDATRYGLPQDLIQQVDRNTLFNFVATIEAFHSMGGLPDEMCDVLHPTRIGNTQGSGMGGQQSLERLYHDHREGRPRKGDTLQEMLINVMGGWITQSYVGSYGPMVHPVSACATALVSLDTAVNLLAARKADFVVAGGFDDLSAEGMIGFSDMDATANADVMLAKGIAPERFSRPNDRRRGGFVEGQGGGTILVTRLSIAAQLGLPVYAVVAHVATHADGIHTSIPAPGLGLLGLVSPMRDGTTPLGRALADFGLTADDIVVVSKHDTSTRANDPNENHLHDQIQQVLQRSEGWPLLVHSQKALLGHAKGGAGAWQIGAALQMLATGVIPGNPHLEDVDPAMQAFSRLCFSDRPVATPPGTVRAVLLTALGFGHIGAGALLVHPDYALRLLSKREWNGYVERRTVRERWRIEREWAIRMGTTPAFVQRRGKPYDDAEAEVAMLLGSGGS